MDIVPQHSAQNSQFLLSVDKEFVIGPRVLVRDYLSKLFGLKWLFYVHDYENIFQTYMTF